MEEHLRHNIKREIKNCFKYYCESIGNDLNHNPDHGIPGRQLHKFRS